MGTRESLARRPELPACSPPLTRVPALDVLSRHAPPPSRLPLMLARRGNRSGVVGIARAVDTAGPNPQEIARAEISAAGDTIDRIVQKVVEEMIVSEGAAMVTGKEKSDTSLQQAIEMAVKKESNDLDDTFLVVLMKYIEATKQQGQSDMTQLLVRVYEATIQHVTDSMPPEIQLLSKLSQEKEPEKRDQMLRTSVSGGQKDIPLCDLESLAITSTRMVEDMEAMPEVPDRNLLVRTCLIREEIRQLALELKGLDAPEILKFSAIVPGRVSHFIKELMPVTDGLRREALMEKVFRGDWEGAAPKNRLTQREWINKSKFGGEGEEEAPDVVRPGALLSALLRLHVAMQKDEEKKSINMKKIQRVADIRQEAVRVMNRLAFGG